MPDTKDIQLPGKVGLKAIGGVMKHLGALTAIGSSTVNSYRRLWDTGFWAPVYADWGYQNRTCGLRVSAPGRFEYRSVDSMHNPYLMGSGLLKCFDDGITNNIDPGKPESRSMYEAQAAGKEVKKLPLSLGEALNRLAEDEVIKSAMPDEMYKVFHWYKNDEWERFLGATTQWDLDTYLDCLPQVLNKIEGVNYMCGIAGLIHRGKSSNVGSELQGMLQALKHRGCLLYTSPSPRDQRGSRMPSSA